ncbi:MAG: ThuA domain-containing protein [Bacteroidota bacterium]
MKNYLYLILIFIYCLNISDANAQVDNRFRQPHSLNQFEVLVYTSPDHWHNLTEPVAILEFQEMAQRHAFGLTWTTLNSRFNDEALAQFDVIVFLQSTVRDFSAEHLESFKKFIQNGGGFVGIHGTSYCPDEPEWFRKLVGRVFTGHPEEQTAVLHVINKNHPSTMHLPDKWIWTDELYSFEPELVDGLNYLITVDESTYNPNRTWGDDTRFTAMGDFHPMAWYHEFDGGRSFYTSFGHMPALFRDKNFLDHIYGGIYWAATGLGVYKE